MTQIRRATEADAAVLAELRWGLRASVRETHEARDTFIARCTTWMASRLVPDSRWRCWVACADDAIAGCVWVQRVEKLPNPNGLGAQNAYLSNFFVTESLRGAGIGSLLMDAALAWCDAHDVDAVFLWPTARSRPLYSRHGFTAAGGIMERKSR